MYLPTTAAPLRGAVNWPHPRGPQAHALNQSWKEAFASMQQRAGPAAAPPAVDLLGVGELLGTPKAACAPSTNPFATPHAASPLEPPQAASSRPPAAHNPFSPKPKDPATAQQEDLHDFMEVSGGRRSITIHQRGVVWGSPIRAPCISW